MTRPLTSLRRLLMASVLGASVLAPGGGFFGGSLWGAAFAETLSDALLRAYETNPSLDAERARQRATRELKPQARAGALPQITGGGAYTDLDQNQTVNPAVFNPTDANGIPVTNNFQLETLSAQVQGELAIFTGFRNFNTIRQVDARVRAGGAQLAATEQAVLLNAATAYFDVLRDLAVLEATRNNVTVLMRQQREAQIRFDVGELTRTDVAQAEARLAGARASLAASEAQLAVSRAIFAEITGENPGTLEDNPTMPDVPDTINAAIEVARVFAPSVVAAKANEEASRRGIAIAKSAFSPTVSLTAGYQYAEEPSSFVLDDEQFSYGVRVNIPIFSGGLNFSRVREARALNDADGRRIVEAERRAQAAVTEAWERLQAADRTIQSATAQRDANALALEGVRREAELGARTTLDVLNAEQEFLNARVELARAERDQRVGVFNLLASAGLLTADSVIDRP